ncbi:MAG: proble transcriptional regulator [Hyphomicrobiales bacterium]|nr:proble transcriptional regulator [Hyphomicrobiales bacterium]
MIIFSETRPATLTDVSRLRRELSRRLSELRLPETMVWEVLLAVAEAGANLVRHATTLATEMHVAVHLSGSSLRVEISDDGAPFDNCVELYDKARTLIDDPLAERGRGLQLISAAFDRLDYRSGARNCLTGWRSLRPIHPLVLIVEDDPALLHLYSAFLQRGYRTVGAQSIAEAIDVARTRHVDAIVTDLHLGDGLGTSFMHLLDAGEARLAPPIIVMTSNTDGAMRQSSLQDGAEFFLSKPVNGVRLRDALEVSLARTVGRAARLARHFVAQVNGFVTCELPRQLYGLQVTQCACAASAGGGDLLIHHAFADRQRLLMVDVMGHGVGAKAWSIAYAGIARALLHTAPEANSASFLSALAKIAWSDPAMVAIIATALVVDLFPDGRIELAAAGHPLPMIVGEGGARQVAVNGALIGVLEPAGYEIVVVDLAEGERLVISTDGVDVRDASAGGDLPAWLIEECSAASLFEMDGAALRRRANDALGAQPIDDWSIVVLGRPAAES